MRGNALDADKIHMTISKRAHSYNVFVRISPPVLKKLKWKAGDKLAPVLDTKKRSHNTFALVKINADASIANNLCKLTNSAWCKYEFKWPFDLPIIKCEEVEFSLPDMNHLIFFVPKK